MSTIRYLSKATIGSITCFKNLKLIRNFMGRQFLTLHYRFYLSFEKQGNYLLQCSFSIFEEWLYFVYTSSSDTLDPWTSVSLSKMFCDTQLMVFYDLRYEPARTRWTNCSIKLQRHSPSRFFKEYSVPIEYYVLHKLANFFVKVGTDLGWFK